MMNVTSRGNSMAIDASHAAKQDDRTFSVEVGSEGETPTVLAGDLSELLDALDCAMEWLECEDPERTRDLSIAVYSTSDGVREQVWAYPAELDAAVEPRRLVELFGFDPVAWRTPGGEAGGASLRSTAGDARPSGEHSPVFAAALAAAAAWTPELEMEEEPAPQDDSQTRRDRLDAWLKTGRLLSLRERFLALWGDKLSRWCLVFGAVCLWLTLTLLEPAFLAPFLASIAGIWTRRGHRVPPATDVVDDWF
jgi:hypothetical protein